MEDAFSKMPRYARDLMKCVLHFALLAVGIACARADDWPRFLGPKDDCSSAETGFLKNWPKDGPKKLWEVEKGAGYACPAVAGKWCVIFHSREGREIVEGLDAATGERKWKIDYEAPYEPQFGAGEG